MNRISIPFELQRRRDLVIRYLRRINRELYRRLQQKFELSIEVKLIEIITIIRSVIFEAIERQNAEIQRTLIDLEQTDYYRPLRLDPQVSEFVKELERILPQVRRLFVEGREIMGATQDDIRRVDEYINFVRKLRQEGYVS